MGIGAKDNYKCIYANPVRVGFSEKVRDIKAGFSHVCAVMESGEVFAWGLGEYGALGVGEFRTKAVPTKVLIPPNVREISCGAMHTAFLDQEGNAYMCGSNEYG
jgi:hypothetical protein